MPKYSLCNQGDSEGRLFRDQEAGGSNPLAPTKFLKDLQTLPLLRQGQQGPPRTLRRPRMFDSVALCSRVLIDLLSDDFDDLSRPDQEVW